MRLGYVIDFLLLHLGDWTLFVFNLADAALTLGPGRPDRRSTCFRARHAKRPAEARLSRLGRGDRRSRQNRCYENAGLIAAPTIRQKAKTGNRQEDDRGNAMSEVELRGVKKRYGAVEAIKMLDLSVEKGQFCALLGPSGCGKSTLLRMIAGLEAVTEGQVLIDGIDVTNVPPAKRRIAMVFQSYALYPHMTVRQNISFSLRVAKAPKELMERRTMEVAAMLQLEELLDRRPAQLSGGQRQRVAIGRALVREPQVFLFDEPLSNLDAMLRVQMRVEIAKLHQDLKTTMIYVTHDQVEAMTLADKIVVLEAGRDLAGRHADGALPPAGQQVRRLLHRLADHELRLGGGARGRRATTPCVGLPGGGEIKLTTRGTLGSQRAARSRSASGPSTSSSARPTIRAPTSAARCRSSSISATRRSCT